MIATPSLTAPGNDRQAFAMLVAQHQGPLFGFLGRIGLERSIAEEIAQEAFLRVWQKFADYRPEQASFATWLFTIARHLALNHLTRSATRREIAYGDAVPEVASEQPSALDDLAQRQQQDTLKKALDTPSPAERSLLALIYVEELSHAEVARIEGCRVGAIKTRVHRAREKLREKLRSLMEDTHG